MLARFTLVPLLLAPGLASAQSTFEVIEPELLSAATLNLPGGVGSPTVAWVPSQGQLHVLFETSTPTAGCAEAYSIGSATSPDGVTWTLGKMLIQPVPGSKHACGARHPAAVVGDDGAQYLAFNVLDAVSDDKLAIMKIQGPVRSTVILPQLEGWTEPTLAQHNGEWMLMGVTPDQAIGTARSMDLVNWTVESQVSIPAAATPWASNGHLSPSVLCKDLASWEWEVYYGGWSGTEAAWAWAISDVTTKWYVSAAIDTWTGDDAWTSFDALRVGADTLMFYEDLDVHGVPRIGLAGTTDTFDLTTSAGRVCAAP